MTNELRRDEMHLVYRAGGATTACGRPTRDTTAWTENVYDVRCRVCRTQAAAVVAAAGQSEPPVPATDRPLAFDPSNVGNVSGAGVGLTFDDGAGWTVIHVPFRCRCAPKNHDVGHEADCTKAAAQRVVECWNALIGVASPKTAMWAARLALADMVAIVGEALSEGDIGGPQSEFVQNDFQQRHALAVDALALLGEGPREETVAEWAARRESDLQQAEQGVGELSSVGNPPTDDDDTPRKLRVYEALVRFLSEEPVRSSIGIHDEPTYGYGALDANGFWEYPVPTPLVHDSRVANAARAMFRDGFLKHVSDRDGSWTAVQDAVLEPLRRAVKLYPQPPSESDLEQAEHERRRLEEHGVDIYAAEENDGTAE